MCFQLGWRSAPEQRLSKTTCSSVSGDYLLCPRRSQIIKHLHPLSLSPPANPTPPPPWCPQSPRGSLLLRLDVWRYKAAFRMSRCDSPSGEEGGGASTSKLSRSSTLLWSHCLPPPPPPSSLRLPAINDTILMIVGRSVGQSGGMNNEKLGFCRQMGRDMKAD